MPGTTYIVLGFMHMCISTEGRTAGAQSKTPHRLTTSGKILYGSFTKLGQQNSKLIAKYSYMGDYCAMSPDIYMDRA